MCMNYMMSCSPSGKRKEIDHRFSIAFIDYQMFFELVWRYVLPALVARFGGVVFPVVFLHLSDGDWLLTHRA